MKIRLKNRSRKKEPKDYWMSHGLHKGYLFTDKGKGVGPFGYDIEVYCIGDDKLVGLLTPHTRSLHSTDYVNSELSGRAREALESHGNRAREKWDGPVVPSRWPKDKKRDKLAAAAKEEANSQPNESPTKPRLKLKTRG